VTAPASSGPCAACGAPRVGPWCHACGQASRDAPRTFREVFSGQTGKIAYTLRRLVTRPGELAREIDEGRDRRAMRPLTLLLNLIPLFFLLGGGASGFSAHSFLAADPTGRGAATIARVSAARGVEPAIFEDRIEQRFRAVYSLLVVVQALSYGAAIGLLERARGKPWIVHGATGIHYMCFSFLVSTVLFGVLRFLHTGVAAHPAIAFAALVINATYMGLSLHRVYGEPPLGSFAKTVAIMAWGFGVSLVLTTLSVTVAVLTA
jgi:hypothetical protein